MLTEVQVPYTGPYGMVGSGLKVKGPTPEAEKRFVSRMGHLPWREFDQIQNLALETAWDKIDPGKNGYGEGRWKLMRTLRVPAGLPNAGEYALDFTARKLIQDEHGPVIGSKEEQARAAITDWWMRAAVVEYRWHYDDSYRPVPLDKARVQPEVGGKSDCSSTVIIARRFAHFVTGFDLVDPAKQNWTGYGNTDWYEDDWPKIGSPFRVGDLGHFHSSRHVIECIKPGDFKTAWWGSNGREAGPEIIRGLVNYNRFPGEFMFVVRPDLLVNN